VTLVAGPAAVVIGWGTNLWIVFGRTPYATSDAVSLLCVGILFASFVSALVALLFGAVLFFERRTIASEEDKVRGQ